MSIREGDTDIFDRRNFLFNYAWSEQIGAVQWFNKDNSAGQCIYVGYRAISLFYWLGWFTAKCIHDWQQGYVFMIYFTRWGGLAEVLYFGYALVVSIAEIGRCDSVHYANVEMSNNQESPRDQWDGKPVCYRIVLWIFTNVMQVTALGIAIVYWVGVVKKSPDNVASALNIHMHAVGALLMLVDLFVIATPCRLQHFWTSMLLSVVYSLFTVVFYFLHGRNAQGKSYIYMSIDFKNSPINAALLELFLIFVATPTLHVMVYGLFRLRICLFHSLETWKEKRMKNENSQILCQSNGSECELSVSIQSS